jgi:hypothetical protein
MEPVKTDFRPRDRWLTFAILLGPTAVLSHLDLSFSLISSSCERNSKMMLHVSAAVFFCIALCGALIGRHYYEHFANADDVLVGERTKWSSILAMVLSVGSLLIIIAMEIPNLILRSCD